MMDDAEKNESEEEAQELATELGLDIEKVKELLQKCSADDLRDMHKAFSKNEEEGEEEYGGEDEGEGEEEEDGEVSGSRSSEQAPRPNRDSERSAV
jgi:DNA-directed RNA polymerase specialized sigma subunit